MDAPLRCCHCGAPADYIDTQIAYCASCWNRTDSVRSFFMTLDWNPPERRAFDLTLATALAIAFPAAQQEWVEDHRRLMLTFPDGCTCTVYEPNFFFCLGTLWTAEQLCARAAEAVRGQHQTLIDGGVM